MVHLDPWIVDNNANINNNNSIIIKIFHPIKGILVPLDHQRAEEGKEERKGSRIPVPPGYFTDEF